MNKTFFNDYGETKNSGFESFTHSAINYFDNGGKVTPEPEPEPEDPCEWEISRLSFMCDGVEQGYQVNSFEIDSEDDYSEWYIESHDGWYPTSTVEQSDEEVVAISWTITDEEYCTPFMAKTYDYSENNIPVVTIFVNDVCDEQKRVNGTLEFGH